ncbi:SCUBE3 [Branchiostoma lanceolatum]|uniref:SCUBE3 protein n=1 Tax=Branchiostoma lanceolatum TaxID=7740 RepID=A0A8K0AJD0_BRALA|nr:SCUBE3 [Branchiostoma lanceolatum]
MVGKISSDQIIDLQSQITTYQEALENNLHVVSFGNHTTEVVNAFTALQTKYWSLSRMLIEIAEKLSHGDHTMDGANTVYSLMSEFLKSHDTIMQTILNATSTTQLTELGLTFRATVCQYSLCFGQSVIELVAKEENSWMLGGLISPTESWSFDQYLTFPEGNKAVWFLADDTLSTSVSVYFQIFGEKKELTLWTEDRIAYIQGSVVVDEFPVLLAGHCNTDTSKLRWNITISFVHGADGLPRIVEGRLESYLSDIVDKSVARYELAQKAVESLDNLFSETNADLDNSKQRLRIIEKEYDTALSELQDSESDLEQLEREFVSENSEVKDHLNALDALCKLRNCPVVQTPGVKCSACAKELSRKIPAPCCSPCYNTRRVIEQYECQTTCFDWEETCTSTHFCRCSWFGLGGCSYGTIWKCTAETKIYDCSETCVKNVTYYDEAECCKTCYEMETGYVQAECCEEVPDLTVTQNPTCLSQNNACRSVRNTVFSRYEQSWGDVTAKLSQLQSARSRRTTNQIKLERLRVQLDTQRLRDKERETLSDRYRLSLNEAKLTLESIENTLSDSFELRDLFDGTDMTGLQIVNVSLEIILRSNNSRIIPLKILVQHGSRLQEVGIVLDLDSIETSLADGVKKIGRTIFGNIDAALHSLSTFPGDQARRRKRSTREETIGSCHTFNEISAYVTEIFTLVQEFEREQLHMKRLFRENEQYLLAMKQNFTSNKESQENAYNKTILVEYFNITNDPIRDIENISQEAQATLNLIETISLINQNNEDSSTGAAAANRLYIAYEEVTRNASYFDICFGFRDCIIQVVEDYYNLLYPTEETEAIAMEGSFLEVKNSLALSLNETSLNRSNIYWNLQSLMAYINTTRDGNWLCGTALTIQQQPMLTNEVLKGNDIKLECNATGDPHPKYEWIKDSKTKVGNSTVLALQNVKEDAEGEYVCIAFNRFGSSSSLPIQVIVTSKPHVTQHPVSQELALGSEVGTTMNCGATGTPTPLIRWFFRRDTLSDWVQVNNGRASDYILIIHPTWQDEGWYACMAENKHGQTMSEPAFLMILDITVAVPTVNITFEIKHKEIVDIDTLSRVKREDLLFSTQIPSTVVQGVSNASMSTIQPEVNITSAPDVNPGHGVDVDSIVRVLETITGLGSVVNLVPIKDVADIGYERLQVIVIGNNLTNGTDYPYVYPHYAKQMTIELNEFQTKLSELEQATTAGNLSAVYGGQNVTLESNVFEIVNSEFLCPPGQDLDENGYICVNCPPGKYRSLGDLFWASECRPCPKGFYQEQQGQGTCVLCQEGTTTYSLGTRSSSPCYEPCPPGSFSENGLKSQNCTSCPVDTYQERWEQTSCTECPQGQGTRHKGATAPEICEIKCKEGQFSETGFEPCTRCPKGSFQNRTGQTSCVDCGISLTTSSGGSTSSEHCREPCDAGFYFFASSTSDAGECSPCPKGYFLPRPQDPREELRKCLKCPFGLTTSSVGATSSSDCEMSCRPGTYSDSGLHPCTPCANGTYQPEEGMKQCMLCPNGTEATTEGLRQCTERPRGTIKHQGWSVPTNVIIINVLSCGAGIGFLTTLILVINKKPYLWRRGRMFKIM